MVIIEDENKDNWIDRGSYCRLGAIILEYFPTATTTSTLLKMRLLTSLPWFVVSLVQCFEPFYS